MPRLAAFTAAQKARRRPLSTILLMALVTGIAGTLLSACGDDDQPVEARIPAAISEDLAVRSEAVAIAVESGDECAAARAADDLAAALALVRAELAASVRGKVDATVKRLVNELNCPPPPVQEDKDEDKKEDEKDEEEKEDGKDNGKGNDGKDNGHGRGRGNR